MEKKRADIQSSFGQMMIVSGMTTLVEDEGFSPKEVIEVMRDIERQVYFALVEIQKEGKKSQ